MEVIKSGYTRVSDVLSIFQAYAHVPRDKLRKAQETGTLVHEAIEKYLKGSFFPLPSKEAGYFSSFLKWHSAFELKPLVIEERFYNDDLHLTGRVDLLAELNGKITLIDFKTGSWAHPEIWKLQGTFYKHLITEFEIKDFLFVQLNRDGSFPLPYDLTYDPNDWEVCLAALKAYGYFNPS